METTTETELIDLKEDSDKLLKITFEIRHLLKMHKKQMLYAQICVAVWAVGVFIQYPFYIFALTKNAFLDNFIFWFQSVSSVVGIFLLVMARKSLDKMRDISVIYNKMLSRIAQDIEKNFFIEKKYQIPTYTLKAIDFIEREKEKLEFIFNYGKYEYLPLFAVCITIFISGTLHKISLSSQETQNKHLNTEIDSLKRVNQELVKKLNNK